MSDISFDEISADQNRARPGPDRRDVKWSARRTLVFVIASSVMLWTLILAPILLLF